MNDLGSKYQKLRAENLERLKELATLNKTTQVIRQNKTAEETLKQVSMLLPDGWQYPAFAVARIVFDGKEYRSPNFRLSKWTQEQTFDTIDGRQGFIQICYTKEFPEIDEGPFLNEERDLILNISNMISGFLNSHMGKDILGKSENDKTDTEQNSTPAFGHSRKLLQRFLNKSNSDRDIYHDLMTFKVKEILLVSSLYDAYSIESEGRFSEHVLGEYNQLNLTSVPRITGATTESEAMELLGLKHFDLVIIMVGVEKRTPIVVSAKIKEKYPYIPVFLLLNNNSDVEAFQDHLPVSDVVDKVFTWNGDSNIFFSMIKLVEDKINAQNDTSIGMARVILLVEDSPMYYSRYLPLLYKIVMEQTRRIIDDVSTDELYKVLRMRARPKILLASNFEDAIEIFNDYKDYILCLISDVKFEHHGYHDDQAGIELVKYAKKEIRDLPTIMQSSDPGYAEIAYQNKCTFIYKNSETLLQDFQSFITHYLGFGNFIYRDKFGKQIAQARTLKEFESKLKTIPDESLLYHAKRDHFSMWLMARGEIRVAKIINPKKVSDYQSPQELRQALIDLIQKFRNEQNFGKIIPFEETAIDDESNIVSLADGSLGGKGRGLAFINTLIHNYDFSQQVPDIKIRAPKTSVVGTDEFELFMERNHLNDFVLIETDQQKIKERFLKSRLSNTLTKRLRNLLEHITKPIAIRSSGLFEDSLTQPFAGIFETYLLPNSHPDIDVRIAQTLDAIRLVYASVYSDVARGYVKAINYRIEEEKMAVVIQEVVGKQFEDVFYPHISGVAQSYNFYPISHMKPEEGFAVAAVGLGKYVVEGNKAYRFSPLYPKTEINTTKSLYQNSQLKFFAVDLTKKDLNFLKSGERAGLRLLDIYDAEKHGTLRHSASVYNPDNNTLYPGLTKIGPRIVNFANILKYNYIPLAKAIEVVLDVVKEALGAPVEIEWAVDLNKDSQNKATFYLLQIKPLIGNAADYTIDIKKIKKRSTLLFSEQGMGNGLVKGIHDVIYIDPEKFDKSKTEEMAKEIEKINDEMQKQNKQYILIGPGRWGTRDRWIGIPVTWPQISQAKVIVETSLDDFPLDASSGSHFFHNVTSMNVGYFSVQPELSKSYINYRMLTKQSLIQEGQFFRHVCFSEGLSIKMDGKQRVYAITTGENSQ